METNNQDEDLSLVEEEEEYQEERTCPECGSFMSYCTSCEMWNCYTCSDYGQCLCS